MISVDWTGCPFIVYTAPALALYQVNKKGGTIAGGRSYLPLKASQEMLAKSSLLAIIVIVTIQLLRERERERERYILEKDLEYEMETAFA